MGTLTELLTEASNAMAKLQFAEAEQSFQQALQLDPASVVALIGLARLALIKKQPGDALPWLDRALSVQPNHAEALAIKGIYFMETDEIGRAIEVLEQARAADPNLPMVYFNLGKSYSELGQFDKAEGSLRKAIELKPDHHEAYSKLSYVLIETGRVEEGIRAMLEAIRIDPFYMKGYLIIGALYENAGKGDLVIRLYQEGLRHNPNAFPLRERLCTLYALKLDFRSAYLQALEIVKRRKNVSHDYLRLGTYAVSLRKIDIAAKAFRTAIELNPEGWEGHYDLGELYMSKDQMAEAREQYQAAVANNRGSYKPLNGMGMFLLMVDHNWDGAIKFLTEAIELEPTRAEPRLNIALAYAKKNDFTAARKFADSVLRLTQPGNRIHQEAERLRETIGTLSIQSRIQGRAIQ